MIDVTQITIACIGLLASVLTAVALPWIRAKLGAQRWEQLMQFASVSVQAAEQMFHRDGTGAEKLDYAMTQVKIGLMQQGISFDESTIRSAIEAVVLSMKNSL